MRINRCTEEVGKKRTVCRWIFNRAHTACSARRHSWDNPASYSDAKGGPWTMGSMHFREGQKSSRQVRSPWMHWSAPVPTGRCRKSSTDRVPGMLSLKPQVYSSRDRLWTRSGTSSTSAPQSPRELVASPSGVEGGPPQMLTPVPWCPPLLHSAQGSAGPSLCRSPPMDGSLLVPLGTSRSWGHALASQTHHRPQVLMLSLGRSQGQWRRTEISLEGVLTASKQMVPCCVSNRDSSTVQWDPEHIQGGLKKTNNKPQQKNPKHDCFNASERQHTIDTASYVHYFTSLGL